MQSSGSSARRMKALASKAIFTLHFVQQGELAAVYCKSLHCL